VPRKSAAAAVIFATGVLIEIPFLIPAVAGPTFQRLFDLSGKQLGICLGAGAVGSLAMAPFAGHIVHRLGAFPILVSGFVGVMVAAIAASLAWGFVSLLASLALMGIASILISNANSSQLADLFPDKVRRTMSLFSALWFGSWAIGAPLAGLWLRTAQRRGWDDWGFRALYAVGFVLTGLCLVLAVALIRPVAAPPAALRARSGVGANSAHAAEGKGSRQWIWIVLLGLFHGLMIGTLLMWVNPTAQKKFDVGDFLGALVVGGMTLGLALGRLLMATVRSQWDELRLLKISGGLGAALFAVGLAVTSYWACVAAFLVGGVVACATYPCILAIIANRFPVTKAKLYGYLTASMALASLVGPALIGLLADRQIPLHVAMGICPLAGGCLVLTSHLWTLQRRRSERALAGQVEAGA